MALTPDQVASLKEQLREQVSSLPEPRKSQALQQINSLSNQALEEMVKQQSSGSEKSNSPEKGVFRMISDGDIKSARVEESKEALAVLDINPISEGHVIIIPKKPVKDAKQMPNSTFTLAKKIAKRIVKILKASKTEIQTETKFGETIINIIPSYKEPLTLISPRKKASESDLERVSYLLRPVIRKKVEKVKTAPVNSSNQLYKIKRRVP